MGAPTCPSVARGYYTTGSLKMGLKGAMSELLSVLAASVANVNGARAANKQASDNVRS
jgi:hypothetical protein